MLKWVGGITAVLSLVAASTQLTGLFSDWRERRRTVADLVLAASMQADRGDYAGGWSVLERADALAPGARNVNDAKVSLAMQWLRNVQVHDDETFSEIVERLLPTLYLGSIGQDPVRRADVFAHIGWANFLRSRETPRDIESDSNYAEAIELDPTNVYAHAMWGHWLLWHRNREPDPARAVALASEHFDAALESGRNDPFVRELQIPALLSAQYLDDAFVELIVAVDAMRNGGEELPDESNRRVRRFMRTEFLPDRESPEAHLPAILERISIHDLHATWRWLLESSDHEPDPPSRYIDARLTELTGLPLQAHALFVRLDREFPGYAWMRLAVRKSIARTALLPAVSSGVEPTAN